MARQHDSIMVVVDKLLKVSHFIPIKSTHKEANIAKICMKEIEKLHGIPKQLFQTGILSLLLIFRSFLNVLEQI